MRGPRSLSRSHPRRMRRGGGGPPGPSSVPPCRWSICRCIGGPPRPRSGGPSGGAACPKHVPPTSSTSPPKANSVPLIESPRFPLRPPTLGDLTPANVMGRTLSRCEENRSELLLLCGNCRTAKGSAEAQRTRSGGFADCADFRSFGSAYLGRCRFTWCCRSTLPELSFAALRIPESIHHEREEMQRRSVPVLLRVLSASAVRRLIRRDASNAAPPG